MTLHNLLVELCALYVRSLGVLMYKFLIFQITFSLFFASASFQANAQSDLSNEGIINEKEYLRAFEEALGIRIEPFKAVKGTQLWAELTGSGSGGYQITQVSPDGLAFRTDGRVSVGDIIYGVAHELAPKNGTFKDFQDVKTFQGFKRQTIDVFCNRVPSFSYWLMRDAGQRVRPGRYSSEITTTAPFIIPNNANNVCDFKAPLEYKSHRRLSYAQELIVGGPTTYFIRPKSLDDFYSDTPEFLDYAIRSIHECETTPCIFNILDDSDRSIGRYSAGFGYLGSQAFFNLDKENAASIGTKYGANFANLASNDIDLIKVASTHYIPRISQIYYWFGLAYGDMCQVHIQNLSQIQLTTTRTRTDGYGNSQVTNEGEDYYPIEEEFAARAVEYGNKWVSGLLQVELQKMTYNFIENWGCSSTPVVNMRQNLLNFGLDQFDAGNVENM